MRGMGVFGSEIGDELLGKPDGNPCSLAYAAMSVEGSPKGNRAFEATTLRRTAFATPPARGAMLHELDALVQAAACGLLSRKMISYALTCSASRTSSVTSRRAHAPVEHVVEHAPRA